MGAGSDNVDYRLEAVSRLRGLLREHDRSGAEETPFTIGIREALDDLDEQGAGESSAA